MEAYPSDEMTFSNIEQIVYSTFKIEVTTSVDISESTCFFSQFKLPNEQLAIAAVSSRHVLADAISIKISIPIERKGGRLPEYFGNVTIKLDGGATCHPNPDIDLAGFIVHHVENQKLPEGDRFFYRAISAEHIPTFEGWEDVVVGDDIVMVGCPHGLEDQRNRTPLVRKGVIASLAKEIERPYLLIDVPTLDGSSGSPVIIDSHLSFNRLKREHEFRSRFYLVGVVSDGFELHEETDVRKGGKLLADLHLGRVVRSDKVVELHQAILEDYGLE